MVRRGKASVPSRTPVGDSPHHIGPALARSAECEGIMIERRCAPFVKGLPCGRGLPLFDELTL